MSQSLCLCAPVSLWPSGSLFVSQFHCPCLCVLVYLSLSLCPTVSDPVSVSYYLRVPVSVPEFHLCLCPCLCVPLSLYPCPGSVSLSLSQCFISVSLSLSLCSNVSIPVSQFLPILVYQSLAPSVFLPGCLCILVYFDLSASEFTCPLSLQPLFTVVWEVYFFLLSSDLEGLTNTRLY